MLFNIWLALDNNPCLLAIYGGDNIYNSGPGQISEEGGNCWLDQTLATESEYWQQEVFFYDENTAYNFILKRHLVNL